MRAIDDRVTIADALAAERLHAAEPCALPPRRRAPAGASGC